jgi:hypothetical protein
MRRALLFLAVGIAALAALACTLSFAPAMTPAQRAARFPYLPLAIVPGMSIAEYRQAIADHRYVINTDCLAADGGLRPGIVLAASPDGHCTVLIYLDAQGRFDRVRYKITTTDAFAAQLAQQVDEQYQAAHWQQDCSVTGSTIYRQGALKVQVFRASVCDPRIVDEDVTYNLDITDPEADQPQRPWTFLRR